MDQTEQQLNNNQSQKWYLSHKFLWIVIGVLLAVVVVASAYWWKIEKQTASFGCDLNVKRGCLPGETMIYTNTDFEFRLMLNNAWKDYRVIKSDENPTNYMFEVPDPGPYASEKPYPWYSPLTIQIYSVAEWEKYYDTFSQEEWENLKSKAGIPLPEVVGSNTTYVFTALMNESAPRGLKNVNFNVSGILSTFKLISPRSCCGLPDSEEEVVFCGGFAGLPCPTSGYVCSKEGNYPDAGTVCKKDKQGFCTQILTWAIDPKTGLKQQFPTPCDVPEGWEKVTQ